ncbi:PLD-like domain-containing protein [Stigmatella aurantiaca]|uniref:PLD-like domain-containing protein n=1 Tax=Stigmatella aurantiaca TaxID=41 RepID=A0A1H8B7F5_STIAU|nr:phospholipase D-like domain-containing protein [Stigmatella aurantiaca]SEM78683.1 PLD-like domain-containing protein [Stigmatella aurantiaca]
MALHFLNTDETVSHIVGLLRNARREAWLICPYVTLTGDGEINRAIRAALKRGVKVNLVFRFADRTQINRAFMSERIGDLVDKGLHVFTAEDLHAKLYWSDAAVVVTSLNLLETTFESIVDIGLWSDDPKDIASARRFFEAEIRPSILDLDEVMDRIEAPEDEDEEEEDEDEDEGFCIRCGDGIDFDPDKPYCLDDYRKWARYGNEDYEDNYCHGCGDEYPATMRKPLCRDCYR